MLTENYDLASAIRRCIKCPVMVQLREQDSTYSVPAEVGTTAPDQPLAIMCEAPGAQEAATSRPLVGQAGQVFNELLEDAGISRKDVVIFNRVRCRPPGNRMANAPGAVEACDEWTQAELAEYKPSVVVLMGQTALSAVFGSIKVGQARGSRRTTGVSSPYGLRVWVATYHPASLLPFRSPQNRSLVISDLQLALESWRELRQQ